MHFQLFGLLGFDSFDLITDILKNRRVIKEPSGFDMLSLQTETITLVPTPHFKLDRAPTVAQQVFIVDFSQQFSNKLSKSISGSMINSNPSAP